MMLRAANYKAVSASLLILLSGTGAFAASGKSAEAPVTPAAIIRQAVAVNNRDWQAQLDFAYDERDIKSKLDSSGQVQSRQSKTYRMLMIDGSPYQRLLEVNGEPISRTQCQAESEKLKNEVVRRRYESATQRRSRIADFESTRAEEHLLMQQMAAAFNFRLLDEEQVDGTPCYRLAATANPDYRPPVEKARVLLGMRGQMWVDKQHFHWVKVKAEVTQPVSFGFFIAHVKPGTQFELDQMPVGEYWLPKYFIEKVNANVLGLYGYRSQEESLYSDYQSQSKPFSDLASVN
ncbi:MAG TPA: hypothetical protein VHZ55_03395 [Bryobacteraceae bacterium]|nr:hypothetical protein [Bryobacteraceae bacterium]